MDARIGNKLGAVACGALIAATVWRACGPEGEGLMSAGVGYAGLERPAIDRERPASVERAVFALG